MFESFGELKKMHIDAWKNADLSGTPSEGASFDALINPENYQVEHSITYNRRGAQGAVGAEQGFNSVMPQQMSFRFLFDGTGVINSNPLTNFAVLGIGASQDIIQQLEDFKKVVYYYDLETHQPHYLELIWGPFYFSCRLQRLTISYKIFKPSGDPLRAEVNCVFVQHTPADQQPQAHRRSADLTHVRIIKDSDTLPLMNYNIYNDPLYYIEVARVNKINHFRQLETGQRIFFPPLLDKKAEKDSKQK